MANQNLTNSKTLIENPIFQKLSNEQWLDLYQILQEKTYSAGEIILNEGDISDDISYILNGEVEILKWDILKYRQFKISQLTSDTIFGEMAFLDNKPRSTTIRALCDTKILNLNKNDLLYKLKDSKDIYNIIVSNIAIINSDKLRKMNDSYVKSLQSEIDRMRFQNEFGKFFIIIILSFGIGNAVNKFVEDFSIDVSSNLFAWTYLMLLLIPMIYFIVKFKYPLTLFGFNLNKWKRSLIEGVAISLILNLLFIGIFMVGIHFSYIPSPKRFMDSNRIISSISLVPIYFVHTYIQEFIARGVIQSSLQTFLNDPKGYYAVTTTALLFGIFHLHLGVVMAVITFSGSILFGLIFLRHKNLLGVSIVHWLLGLSTMYIGLM